MPGELEITIHRDGKMDIQVRGVKGKTCLNLTQKIEHQLGLIEKKQLSSEYSLSPTLISKQKSILLPINSID